MQGTPVFARGQGDARRRRDEKGRRAREPKRAERRGVDGAGPGRAILDERDVDRELGPAREKFARAVERVDQQKGAGLRRRLAARGALLGDEREAGQAAGQLGQQKRLDPLVRLGDRARVVLDPRLYGAAREDLHRDGPRRDAEPGEQQGAASGSRGGGSCADMGRPLGFGRACLARRAAPGQRGRFEYLALRAQTR